MTYGGFKRMTGFCKTHVPADVEAALESIKDNDEAVKNFGIDLGTRMCRRILDSGCPGLHMYTLNTERSSVAILENLGLINKSQVYACLVSSGRVWLDCIGGLPVGTCCHLGSLSTMWRAPQALPALVIAAHLWIEMCNILCFSCLRYVSDPAHSMNCVLL